MDVVYILLIIILILLNIVFFILGQLYGSNILTINKPKFFVDQYKKAVNNSEINKTLIDESKYVAKINTDDIEKFYDSLGTTKSSSENIENSINKLKNMKG